MMDPKKIGSNAIAHSLMDELNRAMELDHDVATSTAAAFAATGRAVGLIVDYGSPTIAKELFMAEMSAMWDQVVPTVINTCHDFIRYELTSEPS